MPRKLSKEEQTMKAARIQEYRPFKVLAIALWAPHEYVHKAGTRIIVRTGPMARDMGITPHTLRGYLSELQNKYYIITELALEHGFAEFTVANPFIADEDTDVR